MQKRPRDVLLAYCRPTKSLVLYVLDKPPLLALRGKVVLNRSPKPAHDQVVVFLRRCELATLGRLARREAVPRQRIRRVAEDGVVDPEILGDVREVVEEARVVHDARVVVPPRVGPPDRVEAVDEEHVLPDQSVALLLGAVVGPLVDVETLATLRPDGAADELVGPVSKAHEVVVWAPTLPEPRCHLREPRRIALDVGHHEAVLLEDEVQNEVPGLGHVGATASHRLARLLHASGERQTATEHH
mmetsp:Transcript_64313/g.153420  ORF Transcript_64313/g.153420 Transcript_64313/m.153420 type:complete len:244 (+) Transcript_64313:162-893(+)